MEEETVTCGECGLVVRDNGEDMEGWEFVEPSDLAPGYWVCPKCQG